MKFNKKQANIIKSDDDDMDDDSSKYIYMYNDTDIINDVDAYIDGPIQHVSKYRYLLQYLRKMKSHDKLTLWLSSGGGYLDTALQLIEALHNTEGDATVIVTGAASSAASLIALSAPKLIVADYAYMMCHAASYGTEGKMYEIESMVVFNQEFTKDLFRKHYTDFLTEDEIRDLLIGKDFWFNSEEIRRRLDLREEKWKLKQQEQEQAEAKPKVKIKKL